MAKDCNSSGHLHPHLVLLVVLSTISTLSVVYWTSQRSLDSSDCYNSPYENPHENQTIHLLSLASAWNHLRFSSKPPPKLLKIALIVKKWPHRNLAGGLERHALNLHLALAMRGHEIHIFTANFSSSLMHSNANNLHFHLTFPTKSGQLNHTLVWNQLCSENSTTKPFDVFHSESVGLFHSRAVNISNLVVSWHGIGYEAIHSNIVYDLLRSPGEAQQMSITEILPRVIDEVKFFKDYTHHVATSDHVGDVLKRIYMIPEERVHIILNGVDDDVYKVDVDRGREFRKSLGIPEDAGLVIGMAGRLVKDKGHPLMLEALKQLFDEDEMLRKNTYVLVAGDGPWGKRYKELGPGILVVGPLEQKQLAKFYNSLDVFVNPTLRAQGLDHTFQEAMLSGVPVVGTRFASITGSIITGEDVGHTFLPTVPSMKNAVRWMWKESRQGRLKQNGERARKKALEMFTSAKMTVAYERLFLCIWSQCNQRSQNSLDFHDLCSFYTALRV